jgi:hypothetical protein
VLKLGCGFVEMLALHDRLLNIRRPPVVLVPGLLDLLDFERDRADCVGRASDVEVNFVLL